jgi:hypothetical protein
MRAEAIFCHYSHYAIVLSMVTRFEGVKYNTNGLEIRVLATLAMDFSSHYPQLVFTDYCLIL